MGRTVTAPRYGMPDTGAASTMVSSALGSLSSIA
jgi:hypothetical protein